MQLYTWKKAKGLFFFFFNDTATTEIYTLSLHDALPIYAHREPGRGAGPQQAIEQGVVFVCHHHLGQREDAIGRAAHVEERLLDRKSTRLNSSHSQISYAVFCLKKKKNYDMTQHNPLTTR